MAKERVDKILAHEGFGSRKDIRKLLRSSEVLLNGKRIFDPGTQFDPENDLITIDGEEREREIARLLSGSVITDAALANARELLKED